MDSSPSSIYSNSVSEYYSDYDPMIGIRIAIALGILITLFAIFLLYKTQCSAKRNQRLIQASLRSRDRGFSNIEMKLEEL